MVEGKETLMANADLFGDPFSQNIMDSISQIVNIDRLHEEAGDAVIIGRLLGDGLAIARAENNWDRWVNFADFLGELRAGHFWH